MFDLTAILASFDYLFSSLTPWLVMIPGLLIGLVCGATPGVQIATAMAIFLPLTWQMNFANALFFLTAIFTGAAYGGGVTAILLNIPGTASAFATAFDGYPMAKQGKHNEALGLSLGASTLGCAFGYFMLLFLILPISRLVLQLGPAEMFVIMLWGISLIANVAGTNVLKGLASGFMGLLLGSIGNNEAGFIKGTMGITILIDGIPPIPAMIGLFAVAELFNLVNKDYIVTDESLRKLNIRAFWKGFLQSLRYPRTIFRGGIIGCVIGAVPGIGGSVSNLLSYIEAKRASPHPESFGKGNPEGIVAAESANSSGEAGSMCTLLALGIPGSGATAIMLVALTMHNVTGGPAFISEHKDLVYAVIFANLFQCLGLILVGLGTLPFLGTVVKIRMVYLVPSILIITTLGSYGIVGHISGPVITLIFAVIGWFLKRNDYSVPAMVIGIVLGRAAETTLIHLHQISGGYVVSYILSRPLCIVMMVSLVIVFSLNPIKRHWSKRRGNARS